MTRVQGHTRCSHSISLRARYQYFLCNYFLFHHFLCNYFLYDYFLFIYSTQHIICSMYADSTASVAVTLLTFICQTLVYLFMLLVIQFLFTYYFFWYLHEPGNIYLLQNLGHINVDVSNDVHYQMSLCSCRTISNAILTLFYGN